MAPHRAALGGRHGWPMAWPWGSVVRGTLTTPLPHCPCRRPCVGGPSRSVKQTDWVLPDAQATSGLTASARSPKGLPELPKVCAGRMPELNGGWRAFLAALNSWIGLVDAETSICRSLAVSAATSCRYRTGLIAGLVRHPDPQLAGSRLSGHGSATSNTPSRPGTTPTPFVWTTTPSNTIAKALLTMTSRTGTPEKTRP